MRDSLSTSCFHRGNAVAPKCVDQDIRVSVGTLAFDERSTSPGVVERPFGGDVAHVTVLSSPETVRNSSALPPTFPQKCKHAIATQTTGFGPA